MLNYNYNYCSNKKNIIPNSIGIVPYSGLDWRANLLPSKSKIIFLIKCISSMTDLLSEVHIYHTKHDDINFILSYFKNVFIHEINPPMEIDSNSSVYPIGKYAMLEKKWINFDYVFFNEGDQIIFVQNFYKYLQKLNNENYLSPHRLERDFKNKNRNGHQIISLNKIKYVIYNLPKEKRDLFYKCNTFRESYGACWIAKKESVKKSNFNEPPNNASLHIPCLSMFNSLKALKTSNIWDFFTDHLSGYSNALKAGGLDIEDYPNYW